MTHPAPVQATHQPLIDDADFTLYVGDAIDVLRTLPDESIHCCVTSPPYWGLRDYGTGSWAGGDPDCDHSPEQRGGRFASPVSTKQASNTGSGTASSRECPCGATRTDQQLGLEPNPEAYVARMVEVFREVRRVLRKDGSVWINLGDSYAASRSYQVSDSKHKTHEFGDSNAQAIPPGLKQKDLVGIPWKVAFALQADGWYLRSEIIWAKPNPMPESVTDRPTKSHEQVFLLTREPRYYFDQEAIREPHTPDGRIKTIHAHAVNGSHENYANMGTDQERWPNGGRNARSVWTIATQPYAEAHFATFPEELPRRCIAAGTSERGCCPVCGAPWERETTQGENIHPGDSGRNDVQGPAQRGKRPDEAGRERTTIGWRPTCDHGLEPTACVILDPFMGSGTVALVARKLGRRSIGIELNPEYAQLAARRLQQLSLLA